MTESTEGILTARLGLYGRQMFLWCTDAVVRAPLPARGGCKGGKDGQHFVTLQKYEQTPWASSAPLRGGQ